jgi:predicted SprT family Zn-dependent metalloprotease
MKKRSKKTSIVRSSNKPTAITPVEYSGLQEAFDHFNKELFGDALPDVFITYQRKAHSAGYFSADRFSARGGELYHHELALNPDAFISQIDRQICQTLGHEMAHVWQHAHGKPAPRGYHNKEWAAKMKAIGLQPSSTGAVGGKETGQHMSDYVVPGGPFEQSFVRLAATGWKLNLESAHRPAANGTSSSKTKFTCGSCGQNAWGKPDLHIVCGLCLAQLCTDAGVSVPPFVQKVTMRSADAIIVAANPITDAAADVQSYETNTPVVETAKPKRRSKQKPKVSPSKPKRGRPKDKRSDWVKETPEAQKAAAVRRKNALKAAESRRFNQQLRQQWKDPEEMNRTA